MVLVQQELELIQVDQCHIGRVQVDSLELLDGKCINMEVEDDIVEETGSNEEPSSQIDPANSHYGNCARWEELIKRGVADIISLTGVPLIKSKR